MSTVEGQDLSKLTVPQLKALCKERNLTGYSKLGKAALVLKLTESATTGSGGSSNAKVAQKAVSISNGPVQDNPPDALKGPEKTANPKKRPLVEVQEERPAKRQSCAVAPTPHARSKSTIPSSVQPPVTPAVLPVEPSAQPALPALANTSNLRRIDVASACSTTLKVATGAVLPQSLARASGKRFKPLVLPKPLVQHLKSGLTSANASTGTKRPSIASKLPTPSKQQEAVLGYLDFSPSACLPTLAPITMPPHVSQRKRVHSWAVILSEVSDRDRANCVLVSRMFRYAGSSSCH